MHKFTRQPLVNSLENQKLENAGVHILGYDLDQPRWVLVNQLKTIDVLIPCITWKHLHLQTLWIEAAKEAGVKRFVSSEWVDPAPKGAIDVKDKVVMFHIVVLYPSATPANISNRSLIFLLSYIELVCRIPEYADYLGYLDFWKSHPNFSPGRTFETFYREIVSGDTPC